jgi:class 3 adenylate cyclase
VLRWLNRYFTAMDEVIRAHGGFLNKFIGDGLLVVYGVPLSQGESVDACNAVRSALAMSSGSRNSMRTARPTRTSGPQDWRRHSYRNAHQRKRRFPEPA